MSYNATYSITSSLQFVCGMLHVSTEQAVIFCHIRIYEEMTRLIKCAAICVCNVILSCCLSTHFQIDSVTLQ